MAFDTPIHMSSYMHAYSYYLRDRLYSYIYIYIYIYIYMSKDTVSLNSRRTSQKVHQIIFKF
jgi:hypothetical protein